jgi:hypothetical protein
LLCMGHLPIVFLKSPIFPRASAPRKAGWHVAAVVAIS